MKANILRLLRTRGGTNALILILFALLILGIMYFLKQLDIEKLIMQ